MSYTQSLCQSWPACGSGLGPKPGIRGITLTLTGTKGESRGLQLLSTFITKWNLKQISRLLPAMLPVHCTSWVPHRQAPISIHYGEWWTQGWWHWVHRCKMLDPDWQWYDIIVSLATASEGLGFKPIGGKTRQMSSRVPYPGRPQWLSKPHDTFGSSQGKTTESTILIWI